MSAKEDIASEILSRIIYERDNSDALCDPELNEYSDNDSYGYDNLCTSYNSGA